MELEGLLEDVEPAMGGLAGDGQGGEEHEDVFFSGDEQAVLAAGLPDLGGVSFVFDLDPDGEASAPNGGLAPKAHLREPGEEVLPEFGGTLQKLALMAHQIAEVGKGRGDCARVPAVGGIEAEVFLNGAGYFGRGDHGAQAAIAAGDGLGHAQDIRLEFEVLAGEKLSGPAKAGGDFVGDEEGAVAGAELADAADELDLRNESPKIADDRLHDEGSDVALFQ